MSRLEDIVRFYEILSRLESKVGGKRMLYNCNGRMEWPKRGVYFFFEEGELRSSSATSLRVVRVGTHAVVARSKATLWGRLSQHRGDAAGAAGNHRGSIFRLLLGEAIAAKDPFLRVPSWGDGHTASDGVRAVEQPLEAVVSRYIRAMPFLWLAVDDDPSPSSLRAHIESNSIGLLSSTGTNVGDRLDPPSTTWLGRYSPREVVRRSGLWNQRQVESGYDPIFLDRLDALV